MDYKARIQKTFNQFDGRNDKLLESFYAKDVEFADPVTHLNGLDKLKKYYEHTYKNVKSIKFEFDDFVCDENSVGASWTMHLAARGLNSGKPFSVPGFSHFKFDSKNKVAYHRDYVDLGAMIYEQLPIQGKVIRLIKSMLRSE